MTTLLDGHKGVWGWNWHRYGRPDPGRVRDALAEMGTTYVLQKAHDGASWFDIRDPFSRVVEVLRGLGSGLVGGWGYLYLEDVDGEAARAVETIRAGRCDFYAFNVEDPRIERDPATPAKAERLFGRVRDAVGDFPLFFTSYANPRQHQRQPYWQAVQAGIHHMPMAYHNAMEVAPEAAIATLYDQHAEFGLLGRVDVVPAGGAYDTPRWHTQPDEVVRWAEAAFARGARSVNWWSLDVLMGRPDLRAAIGRVRVPGKGTGRSDAPDPGYRELSARVEAVEQALRMHVRDERHAGGGTPGARLYTVRPGDTASGIAQRHGLSWERFVALNPAGPRSGDWNVIHPGETFRVA